MYPDETEVRLSSVSEVIEDNQHPCTKHLWSSGHLKKIMLPSTSLYLLSAFILYFSLPTTSLYLFPLNFCFFFVLFRFFSYLDEACRRVEEVEDGVHSVVAYRPCTIYLSSIKAKSFTRRTQTHEHTRADAEMHETHADAHTTQRMLNK